MKAVSFPSESFDHKYLRVKFHWESKVSQDENVFDKKVESLANIFSCLIRLIHVEFCQRWESNKLSRPLELWYEIFNVSFSQDVFHNCDKVLSAEAEYTYVHFRTFTHNKESWFCEIELVNSPAEYVKELNVSFIQLLASHFLRKDDLSNSLENESDSIVK